MCGRLKGVLTELDGDLIEIKPPENRRELEVIAWLREPCTAGKVVIVRAVVAEEELDVEVSCSGDRTGSGEF